MFTPTNVMESGRAEASSAAASVEYRVGTRNRWSRISLTFEGLTPNRWLELSAALRGDPGEEATDVADFAVVGIAFHAEDGSGLDVPRVPGLARTTVDEHGAWLAGPPGGAAGGALPELRLCFYLPAPASRVVVSIRSWRNTRTFHVGAPVLREVGTDTSPPGPGVYGPARAGALLGEPIALGGDPVWFRYGLVAHRPLILRGQLARSGPSEGAFMRIAFRDARGALIAPPYPGVAAAPAVPAFVNIPVHRDASRFTVEVAPPPDAVTLDAGFAAWSEPSMLALVSDPEVLLDDALRLEALTDQAGGPVEAVVANLLTRLGRDATAPGAIPRHDLAAGAAGAELHAPLQTFDRLMNAHDAPAWTGDGLRLGQWPTWPVAESLDWRSDPYSTPAWRIAFQSLTWIRGMIRSGDPAARMRAITLCRSWSRANPWGQPADPLSLHPTCLAQRAEALLDVLSSALRDPVGEDAAILDVLGCEVIQHGIALAEILGRNTLAETLLEIQAAASLLGIGRALPTCPLSAHWTALATSALRRSFDAQVGVDGTFAGASYHRRLELLALGLALLPVLRSPDLESMALAEHLEARLAPAWRGLAALREPDGTLPPFGDAPAQIDGRGWIERLVRTHDRPWMAEAASRAADGTSGVTRDAIAVRVGGRPGPASFTGDFAAQHDPLDHRDCTSFTFATGGLGWVVETGGSQSRQPGEPGRHLATGRAHNVVLPYGRDQMAGAGRLRTTTRIGAATVHVVDTTVHGSDYGHARTFVLLEDLSGIAVFDTFTMTSRPLLLEGFLHLHPAVTVALVDPQRAYGLRDGQRLSVVFRMIAGRPGGMSVTNGWGARPSQVQGFVVGPGETVQPAPVLHYAMSGRETACGGLLIASNADGLAELTRISEDCRFTSIVGG
ncbi:heparinase [Methylobacterium sp. 1030]|uniref:heparinase n=1 Tax=Methylobacterium sp. 1030 TaxID=3156404 RepID=UPI00339628F0